jgi:hypothetical protein
MSDERARFQKALGCAPKGDAKRLGGVDCRLNNRPIDGTPTHSRAGQYVPIF